MGCFSRCFGNSKQRPRRSPRRRPIKASPSLLDHLQKHESIEDFKGAHLIEEEKVENPTDNSPESKVLIELNSDEKKEKANVSGRKKVTFDLNVKVYESPHREENDGGLLDGDDGEEIKELERNKEENGPNGSDSSSSSLFSYPSNHRYQNCRDSDDEFDGLVSSDESDLDDLTDDEDDDYDYEEDEEVDSEVKHEKAVMGNQEQSSESLFSLPLESSRVQNAEENKEVNSPLPIKNPSQNESKPNRNAQFDRSKYANSVLNPVENVSQWKVIKAKSRRAAREDREAKENIDGVQNSELFAAVSVKKEDKEIGVDTSLSTWLVASEAQTPNSKSSSISVGNSGSLTPNKFEDRPILGALTVDEIRQFSATSSPRKSPGWSPDDKPIIGSVGSYWSHTGQTTKSGSSTKSKFAENAKVIWNPMPFETRLEKALEEEGTAEYTLKSVKSAPL